MTYAGSGGFNVSTITGSTVTVTMGIAAPVGSKVCVAGYHNSTTATITGITDSRGNTYVLDNRGSPSAAPIVRMEQWSSTIAAGKALQIGDTVVVQYSTSFTRFGAIVDVFSPYGVKDTGATRAGVGTTVDSPATATPTKAWGIAVGAVACSAAVVVGWTAPWTVATPYKASALGSNERTIGTGYILLTAKAAQVMAATAAGGPQWVSAVSVYPLTPTWEAYIGGSPVPATLDGVWNGASISPGTFDDLT